MANIQRIQVLVVIIISLLIQIALLQAETIASYVHPNISTLKSIVWITNRLGDGSILNLHCKSLDDNLGLKIIARNKSWSFTFRLNIWGTTVLYCHFPWPPGHSTDFYIYDDIRDGVHGGIPCHCFKSSSDGLR
ncbi:unnamed protein product [Brassica rapa]|uniref:S-protein homolog n=2 Tax=Brassica TaxID=3705 RepID=A0A816WWV1_BRANA|nr:unnamed protein product [Brassica napus]CAG7893344.1 unnamed protein product [Brassica rapa]